MTTYHIQHITRFTYSQPISESIVEVQLQPRSDAGQMCLQFKLLTHPHSRVSSHVDYVGNVIHYFDIPGQHSLLNIRAESYVEIAPSFEIVEALGADEWEALDSIQDRGDLWDMLMPSERTAATPLLAQFAAELAVQRRDDPLTLLRQITAGIFNAFEYEPESTRVDSTMDEALSNRKGVCQDYSHIMIALTRSVGIPCRYVSGYLFYQRDKDRQKPDASHAWVEAYLPSLGWIGLDPTNNVVAGERHIRVAVGRDYNDVPPNKGVFKGAAESQLKVEVFIKEVERAPITEAFAAASGWTTEMEMQQSQQVIQSQQQQQQ